MTHRELKRRYDILTRERNTLMQILIALARKQGALFVEKALADDQNGEWTLQTEPTHGGDTAIVTAKRTSELANQPIGTSLALH